MRTKTIFLFIFASIFITTMAFARGPGPEGPPPPPPSMMGPNIMPDRMPGLKMRFIGILLEDSSVQSELGLSKDKLAKIQFIVVENRKFNIKQNADKEILHIDLQEAMDKNTIDEKKVKNIVTKINQINSSLFLRNTMDNVKALNLLTSGQKDKLKQIIAERREELRKKFKKDFRKIHKGRNK